MSKLARPLRSLAAELPTPTTRTYRFKAGDNMAENTFGCIKRNMRRLNLMCETGNAKINFLSSAFLQKSYGLEAVAAGIRTYQEHIMDQDHPMKAFAGTEFLEKLEPM